MTLPTMWSARTTACDQGGGPFSVYKLSISNLLDNKHREFVTGPKIGRMAITEVQYAI